MQTEESENVETWRNTLFETTSSDPDTLKEKERCIYKLGAYYAEQKDAAQLKNLLQEIRPFFELLPKAKTAKIVRSLIELVTNQPNSLALQIELCKESISWTEETKRTFLRQRIQAKLAALYLETQKYKDSLALITGLLREVKRLDDKLLLVEIHLIESRVHFALQNVPRSRASLTAARTAANAIYCSPSLQGQLDIQSGILHAEEKDYKTAFSYFLEAFEGYDALDTAGKKNEQAYKALKYMMLCKVMNNAPQEALALKTSKMKYEGKEVESMGAIAIAFKKRSLKDFEQALDTYHEQLQKDQIVHRNLSKLYETMLEQNLIRIIEPFSKVEVTHVAKLIDLSEELIERKLSQMILDKKIDGVLDQEKGWLVLYESTKKSELYASALDLVAQMTSVTDKLFERASGLR